MIIDNTYIKKILISKCSLFHREECSSKGGTSGGTCASGFGVCCYCKN